MGVYSFQANQHHQLLRAVFPFAFGMANNVFLLIFPHDLVSWKGSESAVDGKGTERAFEQNITVIEWWKTNLFIWSANNAGVDGWEAEVHLNCSSSESFRKLDFHFARFTISHVFRFASKRRRKIRNRCHGRPPSSPLWCQSPNRSNF